MCFLPVGVTSSSLIYFHESLFNHRLVVDIANQRLTSSSSSTPCVPVVSTSSSSPFHVSLLSLFRPSSEQPCVPPEVSEVSELSALVPAPGGVRKLSALVPAPGGVHVPPLVQGFDVSKLPQLQASCPSITDMTTSNSLNIVSVPLNRQNLLCDNSTGSLRPLVPVQLQ